MVVNGNGNVGVGIFNPTAKLHVYDGSISIDNGGDGNVLLYLGTDRHWQLRQFGSDSRAALELASVGGGGNKNFIINTGGNVGIGVTNPNRKLEIDGWARCEVLEITGGADLSERFDIIQDETDLQPSPGMVVSIDGDRPGLLTVSRQPYDRKVAGVISGAGGLNPGMLLGQQDIISDKAKAVALIGRAYCLADASHGSIEPGDLLTTSDVPGHAMKVTDYTKAQGATLGKAMSFLTEGQGLVLVLVNLQ
jgi:hypothetical protein